MQESSLLDCNLSDIFFSQCHFSNVDFLSSAYKNVIFDRCVFTNCRFETEEENAFIEDIEFRYCTFLFMEKYLRKFPKEALKDCITQAVSETKKTLIDKIF